MDVYILGCLKPVGGSSNKLDPRFVSNFSVLNISTPIEDSLNHIYNSILVTHMKDCNYQFDSSGDPENNLRHITTISKKITAATLSVYNTILHTLSPTPSRFHYLFNLRDLSRVYEGLCMALPEKFPTFASLVKLWKNEFMRVFADRLICPEDHAVVSQQLTTKIAEFFGDVEGIESVAKEPLIYGDFRELPLLLDNYEAVKMGVDPENKCFRMYEELIEGNPIQRDADPAVPDEADQGATVVDNIEEREEGDGEEDLNEDGTVNLNSMATSVVDTAPKKEASAEDDPYRLVRQLGQMGLEAYNRFMRPPLWASCSLTTPSLTWLSYTACCVLLGAQCFLLVMEDLEDAPSLSLLRSCVATGYLRLH